MTGNPQWVITHITKTLSLSLSQRNPNDSLSPLHFQRPGLEKINCPGFRVEMVYDFSPKSCATREGLKIFENYAYSIFVFPLMGILNDDNDDKV